MTKRWTCTLEGFEENWIEVSDRWTRAEFNALADSKGDEWLVLFRKKVSACHLEILEYPEGDDDGAVVVDVIEDPTALDEEQLDRLPVQTAGFLGTILFQAANYLRTLGFMSGQTLSDTSDEPSLTKTRK